MHDWLLATWYGNGDRGRALLPLAWLYAGLAALRRWAYRRGLLRTVRLPTAVVVIGNLTIGGTGKTPLVMWLATRLRERGYRPGLVSRGHLGARQEAHRITWAASVAESGDEPLLMARRLLLPVAVGRDRPAAARLIAAECDVLICDDGLQHYRLARDVEVAVVDGERGLGNGRLLPAGPLREPAARLAEVDAVVVNGEGYARRGAIAMRLEPVCAEARGSGERRPLKSFAGQDVHAVAAIGHPGRFFRMLTAQGIRVREHPWPDHAVVPPEQLQFSDELPLLMTEKDAVKLPPGTLPLAWVVEVAASVDPAGGERLLALVEAAIAAHRRRN